MGETVVYTTIDKSAWGEGPWQDEPDKVEWRDEATGYPCIAKRANPDIGVWCGYVAVPPGHPAHGKDYDDVNVDVHGGLTFAGACREDAPRATAVCHVPKPGEPADVWWLGFDCGHALDVMPAMLAHFRQLHEKTGDPIWQEPERSDEWRPVYRDLAYVQAECARLAEQLAGLA
jgi:hypothetical protein